ncbi:hypothetical protein PIB30_080222 [Stylosanthes scabra]|uniref:FAR1 domain-containing protein n=1 Tax=Stylosanthes scabra TaxID=79078 RepID=A0ABU6RSI9_9FABA|nr:hypothetical protein [Stylosanthes scabra]
MGVDYVRLISVGTCCSRCVASCRTKNKKKSHCPALIRMEAPVPDLNDELRSDVVGNNDGIGVVGPLESLTEQDILRRVFRTEDDAYEFYKSFGKVCGFGVRRGDMFKDEDDNLIRRTFFCNR